MGVPREAEEEEEGPRTSEREETTRAPFGWGEAEEEEGMDANEEDEEEEEEEEDEVSERELMGLLPVRGDCGDAEKGALDTLSEPNPSYLAPVRAFRVTVSEGPVPDEAAGKTGVEGVEEDAKLEKKEVRLPRPPSAEEEEEEEEEGGGALD